MKAFIYFFLVPGNKTEFMFVVSGQMSRHFELLNYSEHGTVVDNVVYCCDLDLEETTKSEAEDAKEKEKRQSFQGLDDLLRRNGDKMTRSTSYTEPNEVTYIHAT